MSWEKKLCDVYDYADEFPREGKENERPIPIGFTAKKLKYLIMLNLDGTFETAVELAEDGKCMIPSRPQAESRTHNIEPFPLAEQLKYLVCVGDNDNPRFESYLEKLRAWSESPGAPACLRVLAAYLEKRTLYQDMTEKAALKVKYINKQGKEGEDADRFVCFSVDMDDGQSRLWERRDVKESWSRYLAHQTGDETGLCYVTGKWLPIMDKHPKVEGNAKLISSKDDEYPFQYKGRFTKDGSAVSVGVVPSLKLHSALGWLMDRQGFRRYGMSVVAWHVSGIPMNPPVDDYELLDTGSFQDEDEPDTFEVYGKALRIAALSYTDDLKRLIQVADLTEDAQRRMDEVVILAMQAGKGRMSVTCYQELPGNTYVERLRRWMEECCWRLPSYRAEQDEDDKTARAWRIASPTAYDIGKAVLGCAQVKTARTDSKADKAATKAMRELQTRVMNCIINAAPLPLDLLRRAVSRIAMPQQFTNDNGKWDSYNWNHCVAITCAMIRRNRLDRDGTEWLPELDTACAERDYLYGRLLAVAHRLEQEATRDLKRQTHAVRLILAFVQRPLEIWERIHTFLLPYLATLGANNSQDESTRRRSYQRLMGQIEQRFSPAQRTDGAPLGDLMWIGYSAQTQAFYQPGKSGAAAEPFAPPVGRDMLYGCLLAIADVVELFADKEETEQGHLRLRREGRTNALQLMASVARSPSDGWARLHDRMLPYLEKLGVDAAGYYQSLIRYVECRFDLGDRLSAAPLGPAYLHGYYAMRAALLNTDGLARELWLGAPCRTELTHSREAAFGELLAMENAVERWAMASDPEKDRPSNAMRYLARASQKPNEVWGYLAERMKPYAHKLKFQPYEQRLRELNERIVAEGWNTDAPLQSGWLHFFYTFHTLKEGAGA